MAFLFARNRQKSSADMARQLRDLIPKMDWASPQKADELVKLLAQMKLVLQGTQETESSPEQAYQLVMSIIQEDVLLALSRVIYKLPFESRKDVQVIFSYVFRFKPPNAAEATDPIALSVIIHHRPEVITAICRGYDRKESALPSGTVLREILKHEAITSIILYDEPALTSPGVAGSTARKKVLPTVNPSVPQTGEGVFWSFFEWIEKGTFEVSADAFTTFRDILTKHKSLLSNYLSVNFDLFFDKYNNILVQSESYVTKRQSIKLLGEILLDRANYEVMMSYVDRGSNLKMCMNLLKDERKMVQYEGFHVFKIFVANPNKSVEVERILINNRDKLARFLQQFLDDRTDDEQFIDEKNFLLKQIHALPPPPSTTTPFSSYSTGGRTPMSPITAGPTVIGYSGYDGGGHGGDGYYAERYPPGNHLSSTTTAIAGVVRGGGRVIIRDDGDDGYRATGSPVLGEGGGVGRYGPVPSIIEPHSQTTNTTTANTGGVGYHP